MDKKVCEISENPVGKASIVNNALKFVNQEFIQNLIDHKELISRANLLKIVNFAIANDVIRTVKAHALILSQLKAIPLSI